MKSDTTPVKVSDLGDDQLVNSLMALLFTDPKQIPENNMESLLKNLLNEGKLSEKVTDQVLEETDDLPINNALGKGIGNLLNGRKTAIGILGLLGTTVLPIMFPQLAPVKAVLENLNPESITSIGTNPGKGIFLPLFGAMGGWGLLGKIEKWLKLPNVKNV